MVLLGIGPVLLYEAGGQHATGHEGKGVLLGTSPTLLYGAGGQHATGHEGKGVLLGTGPTLCGAGGQHVTGLEGGERGTVRNRFCFIKWGGVNMPQALKVRGTVRDKSYFIIWVRGQHDTGHESGRRVLLGTVLLYYGEGNLTQVMKVRKRYC